MHIRIRNTVNFVQSCIIVLQSVMIRHSIHFPNAVRASENVSPGLPSSNNKKAKKTGKKKNLFCTFN